MGVLEIVGIILVAIFAPLAALLLTSFFVREKHEKKFRDIMATYMAKDFEKAHVLGTEFITSSEKFINKFFVRSMRQAVLTCMISLNVHLNNFDNLERAAQEIRRKKLVFPKYFWLTFAELKKEDGNLETAQMYQGFMMNAEKKPASFERSVKGIEALFAVKNGDKKLAAQIIEEIYPELENPVLVEHFGSLREKPKPEKTEVKKTKKTANKKKK